MTALYKAALILLLCLPLAAQEPPEIGIGTRLDPKLFRAVEYFGNQIVPKNGVVHGTFPPMLRRAMCSASYDPQANYPIDFLEGPNAQITQVDGFKLKAHPGLVVKWRCWGIVRSMAVP